jgi:hypothetical protein
MRACAMASDLDNSLIYRIEFLFGMDGTRDVVISPVLGLIDGNDKGFEST